MTIHFIYEAKLISLALSTSEMPSNHTAEHIAIAIREILENWKIYDKTETIVADNANVKKAISDYLNKHNHLCVAQTLNLAVQDCIKENK